MTAEVRASVAEPKVCPRCGGRVIRIRRRPIDRLISLIRPVRRYQCEKPNCGWIGNVPRSALA